MPTNLASGEYVSVHSQADSEQAELKRDENSNEWYSLNPAG